jgi:hypothetical protein
MQFAIVQPKLERGIGARYLKSMCPVQVLHLYFSIRLVFGLAGTVFGCRDIVIVMPRLAGPLTPELGDETRRDRFLDLEALPVCV